MKRGFCVLASVALLTVCLASCGGDAQEAVQDGEAAVADAEEKVYGIELAQEEEDIYLPEVIACGEESAWVMTDVKNDSLYRINYQTGSLEKIDWQQDGAAYLLGIVESNDVLYACVLDEDQDAGWVQSYTEDAGWKQTTFINDLDGIWDYVNRIFCVDAKGNIYIANGGDVLCFSSAGEQIMTYELEGTVCFLYENENRTMECTAYSGAGITQYELGEEAQEKWTLGISFQSVVRISSNQDTELCVAADDTILFLDRESGDVLAKADCMQTGISMLYVRSGRYDAEEGTIRLYGRNNNSCLGSWLLAEQTDGEVKQRTELVLATGNLTPPLEERVISFNQNSEDYYVTVKLYDYNSEGITRMMADLLTKNGPDIIDLSSLGYLISYIDMVEKGCLEDLTEYIEQTECSDDINWQALEAYRVDGRLYMLPGHFLLKGMVITPDYEQYVDEWNLDTFLNLMKQTQGERSVFYSNSVENTLYRLIYALDTEFIDAEQKKAYFDTEEFVKLLELCKEYGASEAYVDNSDSREWRNYYLYEEITLYDLTDYMSPIGFEGYSRNYHIYGYPTVEGQYYQIDTAYDCCGIYSQSSHKEGAWEFVESLLEESYQEELAIGYFGLGIPLRWSCMEERAEVWNAEGTMYAGSSEILYMTEEETAIVEDILRNEEMRGVWLDINIINAVEEEAAAYFAGDKSAEETARIIQSRVQLMLEE